VFNIPAIGDLKLDLKFYLVASRLLEVIIQA